jgi:type VI secretion system protein ImpJ
MTDTNPVYWKEGMFLSKKHFEQQEAHLKNYVHDKINNFISFGFGLSKLSIDQQNLNLGHISLNEAQGLFADGTPFDITVGAQISRALELPPNLTNSLIYLALPLSIAQEGDAHYAPENPLARNVIMETGQDSTTQSSDQVKILTSKLRVQLLLESEDRSQYTCIPICRVLEIQTDDSVILDQNYIPPVLNCAVSVKLQGYVRELHGMLRLRGTELAARVANPTMQASGAVQDFLLLQLVNRYELLLEHYSKKKKLFPEDFYEECLKLIGELATFVHPTKRVASVTPYQHLELNRVFTDVMNILRQFLASIVDKGVVPLKIQESKQGIKVALISDRSLFDNSDWIVAVKANMNLDTLRTRFVAQTKISPIEKIRDLISSQLSGIKLEPLPVAPPELPYHTGFLYFRLDKNSSLFQYMKESAGFAFYVSGDLPDVELECWAIKR